MISLKESLRAGRPCRLYNVRSLTSVKGKRAEVHARTGHGGLEGELTYSCTLWPGR